MVAMIYELADSPKFVAGYRNRGLITSVADDGLARRIATFGRIFRLCLPVVLSVVERHGMSPTDTTEVQINCHRDMWQHTHVRCPWAVAPATRCAWRIVTHVRCCGPLCSCAQCWAKFGSCGLRRT